MSRYSAYDDLKDLKDFQLRTVEYVFDRFYGKDPCSRFLVADEVGLGKTFIAKGIIAKSLEYMQDKVKRYDVVYVCSNESIARQNIEKLNILGSRGFTKSTRITYLPLDVKDLNNPDNLANFISLTPGTAFDLAAKGGGGRVNERSIIYGMLRNIPMARGLKLKKIRKGLSDILRMSVGGEKWLDKLNRLKDEDLDPTLTKSFRRRVIQNKDLYDTLKESSFRFSDYGKNYTISDEDAVLRRNLISRLRTELALTCLDALEPDLLILDEFQRFKRFLNSGDDINDGDYSDSEEGFDNGTSVAKALFEYPGVKTLLLSATPYKMYTLDSENAEDDHYEDFIRTISFLLEDKEKLNRIKDLLSRFRLSVHTRKNGGDFDFELKRELENALLKVMCRTERARSTTDRNSMLREIPLNAPLRSADLSRSMTFQEAAYLTESGDVIEYWKSVPYIFNFMKDYEIGKKLKKEIDAQADDLDLVFRSIKRRSLSRGVLREYQEIDPGNPRMRLLFEETIESGLWKLLWLPPSMPYMAPGGVFTNMEKFTKSLIFSSWNAVPNAIASLCSYEAERRMVGKTNILRDRLHKDTSRLLAFSLSSGDKRLTGMPLMSWIYPSQTLAFEIDPLKIALKHGGRLLSAEEMRDEIKPLCRDLLKSLPPVEEGGRADERWYWAAPILLDAKAGLFPLFYEEPFGFYSVLSTLSESAHLESHVRALNDAANETLTVPLGPKPDDLIDRLCDLSLGSPGVCALRSLKRLSPETDSRDPELLRAAIKIAMGFRSLFNSPEVIRLLRGVGSDSYLNRTIKYSIDGNLQALLDEQSHVLKESLVLGNLPAEKMFSSLADSFLSVLSLRTSSVQIEELKKSKGEYKYEGFNAQCHFALRFSDKKTEDSERIDRPKLVRDAFNSPFRPFILASTSIGQEGLDFHHWCHGVTHWNLPSNPTDLEQREGRVQRFKGHAIRKNIAERYGLPALSKDYDGGDPWDGIFRLAAQDKAEGQSDLIPYWIFEEGSARVERRLPFLPYSKEITQFKRLRRSLSLYRLVFGQPRQEDLMAGISRAEDDLSEITLSLAPPDIRE
jgi:hypothetical protein